MQYFHDFTVSALTDLSVCGPLLLLDSHSVSISESDYTDDGEEFNFRSVKVKHNGSRMGFKLAFGIARQLFGSHFGRPALLSKLAIIQGGLEIEVMGRPAFLVVGLLPDDHCHQNAVVTWTVERPASPSLPTYTGPTLALPSTRKPFLP